MKSDAGFKYLKPDSRTSSLVLNLSCLNQTSSLLTLTDLQLPPPLRSESGCHPRYHHFRPISATSLGLCISTYATLIVSIALFHPLLLPWLLSIDHPQHYSHSFLFDVTHQLHRPAPHLPSEPDSSLAASTLSSSSTDLTAPAACLTTSPAHQLLPFRY